MARVHLTEVWLNDAADLSSSLRLLYAGSLEPSFSAPGSEYVTASGAIRSVDTVGAAQSWAVSSPAVDQAGRDWLVAHNGRSVWVRDWLGQRVHGKYRDVKPVPRLDGSGRYDVSFTVAETTPETI